MFLVLLCRRLSVNSCHPIEPDGEHVHLTADEVQARAAQRLPEISRAAVYNILGELVLLGEVREVAAQGRAKRYDPNAHRPHEHLVCSGCGTVRDVHPTGDPLGCLPEAERFGFTVYEVELTYRGLCPQCHGVLSTGGIPGA
ncbi:Fur family transcriptional regulator [Streptomyces sp. NPDC050842]|uniref:Fur family transcriptional regulator n=1 Tax=Streptomyces sp. NPDC050842 TaxID=3365636 RepID=UPI00378CFA14